MKDVTAPVFLVLNKIDRAAESGFCCRAWSSIRTLHDFAEYFLVSA